jgi:tetratricopeptide (TPR) repeat protein
LTGAGRRRPTIVEVGLAALLVLLLGGLWGWRSDGGSPAPAALQGGAAGATGPEIARLTDEGIRFFARHELPEACARFSEAAARAPRDAALRSTVARCFEDWGWRALRDGRAEEAVLLFRQGLEESPAAEELLTGLGVAAIHAGRADLAVEPLAEVVRSRPDGNATVLLARLYDQRDEGPRAVTLLRRRLVAHPDDAEARQLLDKLSREHDAEAGFRKEESAHFVLKFRGTGQGESRQVILASLERLYAGIGDLLGRYPTEKILVILYPTGRFREVTGAHDWVSGLFDGKIRLPAGALALARPALTRVLAHECTHAIVHQIARGRAPRWLQEGLAQHFEGVVDEDLLELPRGLTLAGVEALLTSGDIAKARTGYRTALWLVRDLVERGGLAAIADLLARLGGGEPAATAVERVYGLPLDRLEAQWRLVLGGDLDGAGP